VVYGRRATPYEILSDFSHRVGASYADEDVLLRMARVLAEAMGAARAAVWLRVGEEIRPAAAWPAEGAGLGPVRAAEDVLPPLPASWAEEVRHRGELLGALAVDMPPNDPIDPTRQRLVRDLASQAGLVLRNVRLIEELRTSRRRIVTVQDERAKRLERNIHDGAQQQLVALSVKLGLAKNLAGRDPDGQRQILDQLQREVVEALENLRDLARGIYPPLLADKGLPVALTAQARKSPVPVTVDADNVGRYPQEVEAAVYFCALEALQNVAKYAEASRARVRLSTDDGRLTFAISDDGRGFDPSTAPGGSGLQNMADRLAALGGSLEVSSTPGGGTTVAGWLPVREIAAV
jgi:signal transduction histidine kinase